MKIRNEKNPFEQKPIKIERCRRASRKMPLERRFHEAQIEIISHNF